MHVSVPNSKDLPQVLSGIATGLGAALRSSQELESLLERNADKVLIISTMSGNAYSLKWRDKDERYLWVSHRSLNAFTTKEVWVEPVGLYLSFRDDADNEVGHSSTIKEIRVMNDDTILYRRGS